MMKTKSNKTLTLVQSSKINMIAKMKVFKRINNSTSMKKRTSIKMKPKRMKKNPRALVTQKIKGLNI